jgi:hypothetical protein
MSLSKGLKKRVEDTVVLLREETFHKKEVMFALRAAAVNASLNTEDEKLIAEELYRRLLK